MLRKPKFPCNPWPSLLGRSPPATALSEHRGSILPEPPAQGWIHQEPGKVRGVLSQEIFRKPQQSEASARKTSPSKSGVTNPSKTLGFYIANKDFGGLHGCIHKFHKHGRRWGGCSEEQNPPGTTQIHPHPMGRWRSWDAHGPGRGKEAARGEQGQFLSTLDHSLE